MPSVTKPSANAVKVSLMEGASPANKMWKAATAKGDTMITAESALMDERFIKCLTGTFGFVDFSGAPAAVGWYTINRKKRCFDAITERKADKLPGDKILLVTESASEAIKNRQPLVLAVNYCIEGMVLIGGFSPDSAPAETCSKIAKYLLDMCFLRS